jgi:hypothetical protein
MTQNTFGKIETLTSSPPKSAQQIQQDLDEAAARQRKLKEEANVNASQYNKEQVGELAERSAQEHEAIEGIKRNIEASRQAGLIDEGMAVRLDGRVSSLNNSMSFIDEQIGRLAIVHLPPGERGLATLEAGAGMLGGGGAAGRGIGAGLSRNMKAAGKMRGLAERFRKKPEPAKPVEQQPAGPSRTANSGAHVDRRMAKHEPKCFKKNEKGDPKEYDRQLADQEKGLNNLTVKEYLEGRERYQQIGRHGTGAAQQAARDKYSAELTRKFEDQLTKTGASGDISQQAAQMAKDKMSTLAALHNPDMIAGGKDVVTTMGDKGVNSSIGSQWRDRVAEMDKAAQAVPESERANTKMNTKLKRCP